MKQINKHWYYGACDTCMDFFPIDVLKPVCPKCGDELKEVLE